MCSGSASSLVAAFPLRRETIRKMIRNGSADVSQAAGFGERASSSESIKLVGVPLSPPTHVLVPRVGETIALPPGEDGARQCAVERAVPHGSGCAFSSRPGGQRWPVWPLPSRRPWPSGEPSTHLPSILGLYRACRMQEEMGSQLSLGWGMGAGF